MHIFMHLKLLHLSLYAQKCWPLVWPEFKTLLPELKFYHFILKVCIKGGGKCVE